MKNLKKLIFSAAIVVAFVASVNAQTTAETPSKKVKHEQQVGDGMKALNLTDAQKAQMKANRERGKAANEKFRASLSEDQKALMGENGKPSKENREKFEASLSADQKAMMKANREAEKKNQDAFAATLSADQKAKFAEMRKNRGDMGGEGRGEGGPRKQKPAKKAGE